MIKITLLTASMLVITLSLTACGDDNKKNDTVAQPENTDVVKQQSIYGIVTDNSGNPLVDATIKIGKYIVMTDNAGKYALSIDDVVSNPVILVKKSGYLTAARTLNLIPKRKHSFDISLSADQVTTAFTTSAGINELQVLGATVSIPANTIVNADGSDYTGTVNIAANYYHPDSIAGARAFAQPFAGQDADGSNPTNLVTVGVIDVKLTNPTTGAKLDLKEGSTATLTYPEVTTDQDLASIPLWYYDEEKTIWVKEGVAIRQTDGSYKGQVPHFTLWNLDIALDEYYAILEGCVIDAQAKKPYTKNDFGGQITGRGSLFGSGGADSEGKFRVRVPFNTPLTLSPTLYSVKFDKIQIPALAQNATYQFNDGNCIEINTITNIGKNPINLNNEEAGGSFNELPLPPVTVTLTPVSPKAPFQPPTTDNTAKLIGYNFELDLDNDDKLENVVLTTFSELTGNTAFYIESLYQTGNNQQNIGFLNGVGSSSILTRQGVSIEDGPYTLDGNRIKRELLGTTVRGNQLIQELNNGFKSIATFNDKSISGLKIGDVLLYNADEEDFSNTLVDDLNNLPFSRGVFTGAASCKTIVSVNNNVDFITFNGSGSSSNFDNEISYLAPNPIRGTWAGIPWAANSVADEDQEFDALVNYNALVYEGYYTKSGFANLSTAETNECAYYNEAAKEQILTALREAYPTL